MSEPSTCDRCGLPVTDPCAAIFSGVHMVRHDPVEECFAHMRDALAAKDQDIARLKRERDNARARVRSMQHAHETAVNERDAVRAELDRLRNETEKTRQTQPQERRSDATRPWTNGPPTLTEWEREVVALAADCVKSMGRTKKNGTSET